MDFVERHFDSALAIGRLFLPDWRYGVLVSLMIDWLIDYGHLVENHSYFPSAVGKSHLLSQDVLQTLLKMKFLDAFRGLCDGFFVQR